MNKNDIPEAPFDEPYGIIDEKPVGEVSPDTPPARKRNRSGVVDVLSGDVLADNRVQRHYTFFLYCCLLIICYMGYLFACQRAQRNEVTAKIELQNARAAALVNSTRRIEATGHGRVTEEVRRRGIAVKEWSTPPKEIKSDGRKR